MKRVVRTLAKLGVVVGAVLVMYAGGVIPANWVAPVALFGVIAVWIPALFWYVSRPVERVPTEILMFAETDPRDRSAR